MNTKLTPMTPLEHVIGWPFILIQMLILPIAIVVVDLIFNLQLGMADLNVIHFALSFVLTVAIFHRFLFDQLRRAYKNILKVLLFAVLGFILYFTWNIAFSLFTFALQPEHINANDQVIGEMASEKYLLMFIGAVFLVPVTEETLFRGLIFGTLYRKNELLGLFLSAIIFSSIHVVGYIGQQDALSLLVSFLQYLPAGLALGLSYAWSGSLVTPILIHCSVNMIGMLSMR